MIKLKINNYIFHCQLAALPEEREMGLQFVESIPDNEGMLFDFFNEDYHQFHMKNTSIPLDIIFIDSEKRIVDFALNCEPFSEEIINSFYPFRYALEINAGMALKVGVSEGDVITEQLAAYAEQSNAFFAHPANSFGSSSSVHGTGAIDGINNPFYRRTKQAGRKLPSIKMMFRKKFTGRRLKETRAVTLTSSLSEHLSSSASAADWIRDFVKSDNPRFKGKSKRERIRMAIGAYYGSRPKRDSHETD